MDSLSFPVVHPASEKLKRSSSGLHVVAGLLILSHALSHVQSHEKPSLYFWCLLIISIDIFILVMAGRDILKQLPNVNLFFRLVEIIFFLGIALLMFFSGHLSTAIVHFALSLAYMYLFYCERKLRREDLLSFHHIGITIPGMPESRFFLWTHINGIEASYDSIHINTSGEEDLSFHLRKNLAFGELEQIQEFCRFYLGRQTPGGGLDHKKSWA